VQVRYASVTGRRRCVARERAASYQPRPERQQVPVRDPEATRTAGAASVVAGLDKVVAGLRAADLGGWGDDELGEAVLALESAQSVVVAQQARVLREFGRREAFRADACTTTASRLRWKTSLGYGPAQRRVKRARLLGRMPGLRGAYETGQVATEHVDAVAYRATGWRAARIVEHDATDRAGVCRRTA